MKKRYNLGISLKILNLLIFTAMSILIVKLNDAIPTLQLCLIIAIIAIIFLLPWVIYTKAKYLKPVSITKCVLRSSFNFIGITSWIMALQYTSPNSATALSYMTPIFTFLLALWVCKEKVDIKSLGAILISLIGVYLILQPKADSLNAGGFIALASAFAWSCHDVICKLQTQGEHPIAQALHNFILMMLLCLPFVTWITVPIEAWPLLISLGALSATNVIVLFLAYKYAPLTILMPFSFLRLLFMAVAAFIFLEDVIKYHVAVGAIIIMLAVIYIFIQQQKNMAKYNG